MRRGFRSNCGDALDKRQLAAPSRQTLSDKRSGTAASAKRAGEKLPLGITFARAGAKATMLPTLEPENNHVAAVLTQQAGADQRQRFAHAGQCAPTERQLQAGRRPAARRDARRWRCIFVTIRSLIAIEHSHRRSHLLPSLGCSSLSPLPHLCSSSVGILNQASRFNSPHFWHDASGDAQRLNLSSRSCFCPYSMSIRRSSLRSIFLLGRQRSRKTNERMRNRTPAQNRPTTM